MTTGIPGLDSMIEGGFPFPSTTLVAGGPGTGKTTFALQFLFDGAERGEHGLYFTTFSEPTQWMVRFASRYEFIKPELLGSMIHYVELGSLIRSSRDPDTILSYIDEMIAEKLPSRVVIDPITVLQRILKDEYRLFLFDLASRAKNWQTISLFTGEVAGDDTEYPLDAAYSVDNVLLLSNIEREDGRQKYLEVLKMRGTDHLTGKHSVDISLEGFQVQPGLR